MNKPTKLITLDIYLRKKKYMSRILPAGYISYPNVIIIKAIDHFYYCLYNGYIVGIHR
jgi:hypothetical protein